MTRCQMVYGLTESTGLYYATQAGITIKTTQKESKTFLVNLMTSLEGVGATSHAPLQT